MEATVTVEVTMSDNNTSDVESIISKDNDYLEKKDKFYQEMSEKIQLSDEDSKKVVPNAKYSITGDKDIVKLGEEEKPSKITYLKPGTTEIVIIHENILNDDVLSRETITLKLTVKAKDAGTESKLFSFNF